MTPDKTPTDAELDALDMAAKAIANQNPIGTPAAWRMAYLKALTRAVLAKWGSPVVAGESVAELVVDRFTTQLKALPASHDVRPYGTHLLCLVPQPTQAQAGAVPLTPSQYNIALGCATDIPPSRYEAVTRAIERAHGIKGGQHGTDT